VVRPEAVNRSRHLLPKIGLRDDRPFLLYVCSALFGERERALFVQRWIRALRATSLEPLASTPVVVRRAAEEWADVDLAVERDVTLWGGIGRFGAKAVLIRWLTAPRWSAQHGAFLEGAIAENHVRDAARAP
jgi:hypothetical protein